MNTEITKLLERIAGNLEGIAAALDESHPSLAMWARDLAHSIDTSKHVINQRKAIQKFCKAHEDLAEFEKE